MSGLKLDENRLYTASEVSNLLILISEKLKEENAKYFKIAKDPDLMTAQCFYCNNLIIRGHQSVVFDRMIKACRKCKLSLCKPCMGGFVRELRLEMPIYFFWHVKTGWKTIHIGDNVLEVECPKCSIPD